MGQAKQRGSREQRVAVAVERNEQLLREQQAAATERAAAERVARGQQRTAGRLPVSRPTLGGRSLAIASLVAMTLSTTMER